jgi:hypothetical protein
LNFKKVTLNKQSYGLKCILVLSVNVQVFKLQANFNNATTKLHAFNVNPLEFKFTILACILCFSSQQFYSKIFLLFKLN